MTLRKELDNIVNGGAITIADQPKAVAALASRYPHSICHLPEPAGRPYNCFTFALSLRDSHIVYKILGRDADWYGFAGIKVGSEFIAGLIADKLLITNAAGKLVVYSHDGTPSHAGLVTSERVRSKWGIGNLWDHAIWEVPNSYGEEIQRYTIPPTDVLENAFGTYAAKLIARRGGYPD